MANVSSYPEPVKLRRRRRLTQINTRGVAASGTGLLQKTTLSPISSKMSPDARRSVPVATIAMPSAFLSVSVASKDTLSRPALIWLFAFAPNASNNPCSSGVHNSSSSIL